MAGPPVPSDRRWRIVAAVVVGALIAAGAGYAVTRHRSHGSGDRPLSCAGSPDLCDRRLDELVVATTHNSMAATDDGFSYASQTQGIAWQLDHGVRGFLVDAWLGTVRQVGGRPVVYTDRDAGLRQTAVKAISSGATRRALRIRQRAGRPPVTAPREVYLCHEFCELGAVKLTDVVDLWRDFLRKNPGELLEIVVQDELPARRLLAPLQGLAPYLARIDPEDPPTLRSLVTSGRRVVLGLENGDLGPRIPNVYDDGLVQEVPYNYPTVRSLERSTSCRTNRGRPDAPLFLLNNWVSPASRAAAARANGTDFLVTRATACGSERGRAVTLVAIDFADLGGLVPAVEELNRKAG
ncbi:hypothetical protein [Marmoricola sp. RAF53]|uniref:hypothetical protein n=1 Tax=Marmoricola sp. RAF53 TaxID=3233059 RepID=UPI003F9BBECD